MSALSEAQLHAQLMLLALMTPDTHKFCLGVGTALPQDQQDALERMQLQDWVRLIDVVAPEASNGVVCRVFLVQDVAVEWYQGMLPFDTTREDRAPRPH